MYAIAELLDELVDVEASPVALVRDAVVVGCVVLIVGDDLSRYWVWIEIVIDMESIDVVASYDVGCYGADIVAVPLVGRIEYELIVIHECCAWT